MNKRTSREINRNVDELIDKAETRNLANFFSQSLELNLTAVK